MRDKAVYDTLKPMGISSWQQELRAVIREPQELLNKTGHGSEPPALAEAGLAAFPLRVPESYLKRIAKGQTNDPLLRQVLPLSEEDIETPGFSDNPVGEFDKTAVPGLIRKYPGRVLLITTSVCAIHCRYCFRRHYPYNENNPARENWTAALETIRADQTIREVILSGGDPLTLGDAKLTSLMRELETIPHLQWLRIHTRMPIVIPARITEKLVEIIATSRFKQTVVIHANHPNEIDAEVTAALSALHNAGIQLLNQSVLLREVNDETRVLAELSERLYANHVLPYYLHMLDPVAGAAHFNVDEETARRIMRELRNRLPGYLVPRLVRELEGESAKTLL